MAFVSSIINHFPYKKHYNFVTIHQLDVPVPCYNERENVTKFGGTPMRIYTGRSRLMEAALIEVLRRGMAGEAEAHIVVVPKQLTLQTERTLLDALALPGSFRLQILSPERLCERIFEAAGQPEGVRVDERGRVMLVRAAARSVDERLSLYRGAVNRRGFADRCARQLELIRQAGLTPAALFACAEAAEGMLRMKLDDLGVILEAYEALLEGRFQDGEAEFARAVERAGRADFLRRAHVYFYGFDLTPPSLHALIGAVAATCPETSAFLPLANDENARDFDAYLPLKACYERLFNAVARACGERPARVRVEADGESGGNRLVVSAPGQAAALSLLSRELFAFPTRSDPSDKPPRAVQLAMLRNPLEECRFAAALCRRLVMANGWRWSDLQILCRDLDAYRQPLQEAFRACEAPLFLSASRPASRHPLAECLTSALRLSGDQPRMEDALALLRTGCMPLDEDEADRLANHAEKYGLRPRALLRPLRRGTEAEQQALEPVRARFAAPVNALKNRLRRADTLKSQLAALFAFLTDVDAPARLQARLDALVEADLRQQAGEESQVWNRVIGALDQMAGLMGDVPLPPDELRRTLEESLDAAIIKPLPQSGDAVYAQTTDRIAAQRCRALLILGETDRASVDADGLLNQAQQQAFARLARAYVGSDGAELSRMRRFYLKSAVEMASDYVCVSCPLSGPDDGATRPGALIELIRGVFPALKTRGGVLEDAGIRRMLRSAPEAAASCAARALAGMAEGERPSDLDTAALAGLKRLADTPDTPAWQSARLNAALDRIRLALNHGESADRLNPATARALYGELRRQSVTRLEKFADCPFAYFTRYGLRPERIEPYELNVRDEGTFFHDAVHEFLLASMDDLNALDTEQAEARMDGIADNLLDLMAANGPLGDSAVALAERRRLKATARTCAAVLAEHMRQSRFNPAAVETDFGAEDGAARLTVNAASGVCTLEGRIDRIDEWAAGGYLRVIDYKRGGKPMALDAVYHGLSLQLPVYLAAAMKKRGEQSAGVYYFNLDEGIQATQSVDPGEVEKTRRDHFRLTGLAPDDTALLEAQSPNYADVLNVRVNAGGGLRKGTLATDANGFRALMSRTLQKAGEHLDGIRAGLAQAAPARWRQHDPCQYCDWRGICRFDERMDAARIRRFEPMRGEVVLEKLKLEED